MKSILFAVAISLLGGCAVEQGVQMPKEVKVPVPVACIDAADVPEPPKEPGEAELLALDTYRRTLTVWIYYVELAIYKQKAAAIIERCSRVPAIRLNAWR